MTDQERLWTISELAEASGTSVRTIRYYIGEGLLPSPRGRGRTASYDRGHLQRLFLIRRLVEQRVPLQEIRRQASALSGPELESLLENTRNRQAEEDRAKERSPRDYITALLARARQEDPAGRNAPPSAPPPPAGPSPQDRPGVRTNAEEDGFGPWKRYALAPGVELHISRSAERRERGLIERLLKAGSKEEQGHE